MTALTGSSGKEGMKKKVFHHTEIHPAENGGLIVEHHHMSGNDGYPSSGLTEKHAFGEDEHGDAMKEAHSKCCGGDCDMSTSAMSKGSTKGDRGMMRDVKNKVAGHLASLGGKQKQPAPEKN